MNNVLNFQLLYLLIDSKQFSHLIDYGNKPVKEFQ